MRILIRRRWRSRLLSERFALGYVLTDRGTVTFAATDFRASPLHAIDSGRTVEALAEFLAVKPGDTDSGYFATYTERQRFWAESDGPSRLYGLIGDLPGDTEFNAQTAADAELRAEHSGEIRAWHVRPLDRTDLPPVDLLADSPSNARAQYPAYVAAWMDDTGRDLDIDDDLFSALGIDPGDVASHRGRPVVTPVRGQAPLDWAVEHVNHWDTYRALSRLMRRHHSRSFSRADAVPHARRNPRNLYG